MNAKSLESSQAGIREPMETLPVFLRVRGKRAAVVGGGSAAARRTETLGRAGALVTVFAARRAHEFDA